MSLNESVESHIGWRHFGKRYLLLEDFIRLCDAVGLYHCNEHELENYEVKKVMYPAARLIMPDEYAVAFWSSMHHQNETFEFDDKFLSFHQLNWAIRYPANKLERLEVEDLTHPIDKSWDIVMGLQNPVIAEYKPWNNYKICLHYKDYEIKHPTISHFYHHWQIYELFEVRRNQRGMYRDNTLIPCFGNPQDNLPYLFEAVSTFQYVYQAYQSHYVNQFSPNNDGFILLDQPQQDSLSQTAQKFANEIVQKFQLDEESLCSGLREMMSLHASYKRAERIKLSHALRKDIWKTVKLWSFAFGTSAEEIADRTGVIDTYIGNYLELLFPNRRKQVREESVWLLRNLTQEHNKNVPTYAVDDKELEDFLNYVEATSLVGIEYVIVELNKGFLELNSWHPTITFLNIKALASFPESLMKTLIVGNSDAKTKTDFRNQRNPGMTTLANLVFRNISPSILSAYQEASHWQARDTNEFTTHLSHLLSLKSSAVSEVDYIGRNLALATLLRNFTSHLLVDDPQLLQGQYVECVRSVLTAMFSIWHIAKKKSWV